MNTNINAHGIPLTKSLRSHIEAKIHLSLARFGDRISRIDITLLDINGPKGGRDMRCRVKLKPNGYPTIIVQETSDNLPDAINSCFYRTKRRTSRLFDRLNNRKFASHEVLLNYQPLSHTFD